MRHRFTILLSIALLSGASANAKSIRQVHGFEPHFVPPPEAGLVNIRDFGAVGDGKTDDTAAFQKAIEHDAPRSIYIPAGTYLIRDSLVYGLKSNKKKRTCLIGETASSTIIKLADNSPGFQDPRQPKVFIHTRPPKQQGEQNMHQYLYHLTIEIGCGNPGAIALNYHSNNTGAIKDVVIRATDPTGSPGHTGLACSDWEVGPANARYLTVDGFQTGIALTRVGNYFTMEHVTVRHCPTGVVCATVSIRDLVTENCDLPVRSTGQTVLVDAVLSGKVSNDKGGLLLRNVRIPGSNIVEYTSEKPISNWPTDNPRTLNLPIEESPEIQYPQTPADWAVLPKTGDITAALQQAIDTGKRNILIPGGGGQTISQTVHLRHKVERIMGTGVTSITFQTGNQPVFRVEDGDAKVVILELLYGAYGSKSGTGVVQASPRTLVLRHGSLSYETAAEGAGGKVFFESLVSHIFCRKVKAWARDMDTEAGGPAALNLVNDAGTLWVLGQKTEDFATKLKTINGGSTELLGGIYRQNWDRSDFQRTGLAPNNPPPLFESVNSNVSLTFTSWGPGIPYATLVRETRGPETRNLKRAEHGGSTVLFVGSKHKKWFHE